MFSLPVVPLSNRIDWSWKHLLYALRQYFTCPPPSIVRVQSFAKVKKLSVEPPVSGEEISEGVGKEGIPSAGEGEGAPEGKRAVASESIMDEVDRLRQGIKAAVSSIARYKTRWAHVSVCLYDVALYG